MGDEAGNPVRVIGRYRLYQEIAAGGMATVHLGRLLGPVGFSRTVAIKRLHSQFAKDAEFVTMFLDEARLAARIHHPNVVATLDVVAIDDELFLVMEYLPGETLSRLMKASPEGVAPKIAAAIMAGALHGLHAAHEATNDQGVPLGIVHRDVSPQNIIVGVDGMPRVLDFGVAKASDRLQTTGEGRLKGKLRYMPPEQVRGAGVSRKTDIYAAAVVLHELVTGRPLFSRGDPGAVVHEILSRDIPLPSSIVPSLPSALDDIILRGLARDPDDRYADAREMAMHLEEAIGLASASQIGAWVSKLAGEAIASRAAVVSLIERSSTRLLAVTAATAATPHADVATAVVALQREGGESTSAPGVQTPSEAPAVPTTTNGLARRSRVAIAIASLAGVSVLACVAVVGAHWGREARSTANAAPQPTTTEPGSASSARVASLAESPSPSASASTSTSPSASANAGSAASESTALAPAASAATATATPTPRSRPHGASTSASPPTGAATAADGLVRTRR